MNVDEVLKSIRAVLDDSPPIDSPNDVMDKLNKLASIEGTSAELIAYTNKVYNEKILQLTTSPTYKGMSATDKKLIFAGVASNEIYNMQLSEAYNKEIHYQIEAIRTQISYLKEQEKNSKFA